MSEQAISCKHLQDAHVTMYYECYVRERNKTWNLCPTCWMRIARLEKRNDRRIIATLRADNARLQAENDTLRAVDGERIERCNRYAAEMRRLATEVERLQVGAAFGRMLQYDFENNGELLVELREAMQDQPENDPGEYLLSQVLRHIKRIRGDNERLRGVVEAAREFRYGLVAVRAAEGYKLRIDNALASRAEALEQALAALEVGK